MQHADKSTHSFIHETDVEKKNTNLNIDKGEEKKIVYFESKCVQLNKWLQAFCDDVPL